MHSYIIDLESSKESTPGDLEYYFHDGLTDGADYTDQLPESECKELAAALEEWFPFCHQRKDDPTSIDIDQEAAKRELEARYKKVSEIFAKMAKGESSPDCSPYMATVIAGGDDYGIHFVGLYGPMNDLEFIRYCAENDEAPSRAFVRKVWDVHY